ncbi:MAG: sigma-70 family RNA polymerase sigma factor [Planctomycetes bacterium]|nr:sigma-70 family RNA polymerase sigma factor [Planctomycetota bacterium]
MPADIRSLSPDELLAHASFLRGLAGELVGALPEEQRTVLYLRYFEDLMPTAIAARLSVPVKTSKARHKPRSRQRTAWGGFGPVRARRVSGGAPSTSTSTCRRPKPARLTPAHPRSACGRA